jgi:superfamily II DNA or RNA helicase
MTALDLRSYQTGALSSVDQAEREGVRRPLVVHPTGTGKGLEMAQLATDRADRGRSLVLVHREELAAQFIEKLSWQGSHLSAGIVKANLNEVDADVVVASIDTVTRDGRLADLLASAARSPFGTVIADEAHLAPAPKWVKVLKAVGSFNPYGPLTVGFTATPERDKKTLGVWERVVHYYSLRQAIYEGHLVPILPAEVVETTMDMRNVRKTGGDFSEGDLGKEMEESGAIQQIADAYVLHAAERKGLAFTPTIKTAHALAQALRDRGIKAEALDGGTEKEERRAILGRLRSGETQVVTNCAVLTTGFDEPSISCVVMARPTTSHTLYMQCVGRGTRLFPGKANLLILDMVGASNRHELISQVDLGLELDDPKKKREGEPERVVCPSCGSADCGMPEWHRCALCHRFLPAGRVNQGKTRHENCESGKAGKIDVFGSSKMRWLPVENGYCLGAGTEVVVMLPIGDDVWKLAAYKGGKVEMLHDQIPGDWARGIGEDRAKAFLKLVERDARWLAAPATDLQKSRLIREGLPESALPRVRTKGDAADLVTRIQGRRAVRKMSVS